MRLFNRNARQDLRGRWSDVFSTLAIVMLVYMSLRWAAFEPFVIPSGSMKPTLLIQDYVFVKKWVYGLRIPLTENWLIGPKVPQRGDIVVFRSKEDSFHFLVKRVIGLPGDHIVMDQDGKLSVNGQQFKYEEQKPAEDFKRFTEIQERARYTIQLDTDRIDAQTYDEQVPEGHIFLMGDNRDHSMDSRFWGSLPLNKILGKVSFIWMSCEDSDKVSSFLCPPESFRTQRILKVVH